MIAGMFGPILPNADSSRRNGRLVRMRMLRSSGAVNSAICSSTEMPNTSRAPQRLMLATTSRPSTGVLSWNFSPSRRVMVQSVKSAFHTAPSAICGWIWKLLSVPNSVSKTR